MDELTCVVCGEPVDEDDAFQTDDGKVLCPDCYLESDTTEFE